jgi:hypothetical protein
VRERECVRHPGRGRDRGLREEAEQDDRQCHQESDEGGGTRLARQDTQEDAEGAEGGSPEHEADCEERQAAPRLPADASEG